MRAWFIALTATVWFIYGRGRRSPVCRDRILLSSQRSIIGKQVRMFDYWDNLVFRHHHACGWSPGSDPNRSCGSQPRLVREAAYHTSHVSLDDSHGSHGFSIPVRAAALWAAPIPADTLARLPPSMGHTFHHTSRDPSVPLPLRLKLVTNQQSSFSQWYHSQLPDPLPTQRPRGMSDLTNSSGRVSRYVLWTR